jgi:ACT domain-containing protein
MSSVDLCKVKDDPNIGCPPDLPPDPKNTCEKINNEYDVLINQAKEITSTIKEISLTGLLKSLGSNNKLSSKMQNVINNVNSQTQNAITDQKCANIVTNLQQNTIKNTPECVKEQGIIIQSLASSPNELKQYVQSLAIGGIKQSNLAETKQQCVLTNVIQAALKMDASVESAALVKLLQKSSDLMANNETDSDFCNVINNTMTSCQYIKSNLCCANEINNKQQNSIECVGAQDVTQSNSKTALQICNLTGSTTVDASLTSKLKSSASLSISQTAVGTSIWGLVVLLLVIFIGPILPVYGMSKVIQKEIMIVIIGVIFLILGILCLVYYKPPSNKFIHTERNKPIFNSKDYKPQNSFKPKGVQDPMKAFTYKDARDICLNDENCLAIDFSLQQKLDEEKTINDSDYGIAVFYDSINNEICQEEFESEKNTYFTSYKQTPSFLRLDIFGYILLSAGLLMLLTGFFILFKKRTDNSSSKV